MNPFLIIFLGIIALSVGQDDRFVEIGSTSAGNTLYLSRNTSDWFSAHYWCSTFRDMTLASVISVEERLLLVNYFEPIHGPSFGEYIWTAATTLGSSRPFTSAGLRWSDGSTEAVAPWCCLTEPALNPSALFAIQVCGAGRYRQGPGANPPFDFLLQIRPCTEQMLFLCKTRNV